jgi:hypothetical protein
MRKYLKITGLYRPSELSLLMSFDSFKEATQLLQQRLGTPALQLPASSSRVADTSPCRRQLTYTSDHDTKASPSKAPMHDDNVLISNGQMLKQGKGLKQAQSFNDEEMSAFSAETQALLRQIQAVRV